MIGKWYVTTKMQANGGITFEAERRHFDASGNLHYIEGGGIVAEIGPPTPDSVGDLYWAFEDEPHENFTSIRDELADRLNRPAQPDWHDE